MSLLRLLPDTWKETLRRRAGAVTTPARLKNLCRAGFAPRQIIDAGAYRGEWARMIHAIFPEAAVLMIEPQPARAQDMLRLCREHPLFRFRSEAVGAKSGHSVFLLAESNSRMITPETQLPEGPPTCTVTVATLAELAVAEGFAGCEFLKLDLQGHELEALAGAGELFGRVEVILTEVSLLRIGPVPIFREVHEIFHNKGYRLYDIFGLNHRPLDGALWQADLVFVREDSPLLGSLQFS
ncbi:MAG: FkbM family methyltransferase [Opitutus sp.]